MTKDEMKELSAIFEKAKPLAAKYYQLTQKHLGIQGELGEFKAAQIFDLTLMPPRSGFDAKRNDFRFEIKTKVLKKSGDYRGKLAAFKQDSGWDFALAVLLRTNLEVDEIYMVDRESVVDALNEGDSKGRNERRQLSLSKFKSLAGKPVWCEGRISSEIPSCLK